MFRNSGSVTSAMQHAHDENFVRCGRIINRIVALKDYAQAARQLIAGNPGQGEFRQVPTGRLDLVEQPCRRVLGILGNVSPNLGKVVLCRVG